MVITAVMVVVQSGMPTRAEDATMRLGHFETKLASRDFVVGTVQLPNDYYVSTSGDSNITYSSVPTVSTANEAWGDDSQGRTGAADRATLESVIPKDASSVMLTSSQAQVQGETLKLEMPVTVGQIFDPRFEGRYELLEGTWGSADGLQITTDLAETFDVSVGSTLQVEGKPLIVSGLVRDRSVFANSGNMFVSSLGLSSRQDYEVFLDPRNEVVQKLNPYETSFFVEKMGHSLEEQAGFNAKGVGSIQRGFLLDPPLTDQWTGVGTGRDGTTTLESNLMIFIVAFFVFLEVGMLAGAAFAVGAKKQKRVLSLLASNGAGPGTLRMLAGYTGLYLGLVGILLGTALGLLVAWLTILWGNMFAVGFPGWHVPWATVVPLMMLALSCAVVASLVPSWVSTKHSALHALRGAGNPSATSAKKPIVGYILLGLAAIAWGIGLYLGLSATTLALLQDRISLIQYAFVGGMLLCTAGMMLVIGRVLGFAGKVGHKLPLSGRLAIRDVHRNAARNTPVVASVIAGVALTTAITVAVGMGLAMDGPTAVGDSDRILTISLASEGPDGTAPSGGGEDAVLAELARLGHVPVEKAITQTPFAGKHEYEPGAFDYSDYGLLLAPSSKCRYGVDELLSADKPDYKQIQRWADDLDMALGSADRFSARYCNIDHWGGSPLAGDFNPVVTDRKGLELLLGKSMSPAIGRAFDENKVIVSAPEYVSSGGVLRIAEIDRDYTLELTDLDSAGMSYGRTGNLVLDPIAKTLELEAVEIKPGRPTVPRIIIPHNALRGTGATLGGERLMVKLGKSLSMQESNDLSAAVRQHGAFYMPTDTLGGSDRLIVKLPLLLLIAASLLVLTTTVITTGLALADGREDARTLSGIGATTRTRRKFSGIQAGFTALLGTGFGFVLGAIPMLLLMSIMFGMVDISMAKPLWLLLAIPPVAGALGWLMVPRKVATARVGA
ncbi:FtsX-like permease family protein [Paeniglutamicibacter sp. NPDC012692]|uniref:ABC transporter permease n=1 Tax=Paeniglutamicibacter sp. NPDC012692 TaxID=3364388 RepID=UPI0036B9FF5F